MLGNCVVQFGFVLFGSYGDVGCCTVCSDGVRCGMAVMVRLCGVGLVQMRCVGTVLVRIGVVRYGTLR